MSFFKRFFSTVDTRRMDAEIREEIESHIRMRTEANIAEGMTPDDAYRAASRAFGNRVFTAEQARTADVLLWLEHLKQDVRYGLLALRKTPAFALIALVTLMLGIGANTSTFTIMRALLLRKLPVTKPDELVRISFSKPGIDFGLSGPMYDELSTRQHSFSGMLAWGATPVAFTDSGESAALRGAFVSGNAFQLLGVQAALGRLLTPTDDRAGGGKDGWPAVISYDLWQTRFGGSSAVVGKVFAVEQIPVTIVGVSPRRFEGVEVGAQPQIMLPLEFEAQWHGKAAKRRMGTSLWLTVIARLKPGVSQSQALAEIKTIEPGMITTIDPKGLLQRGFFADSHFGVEPGATGRSYVRAQYREPLLILQMLAGVILLTCCANLAGLFSARASARRHELAVRAALGASRWRLFRQLLIESGLLVCSGAAAAILLSKWLSSALVYTLMRRDSVFLDLAPDSGVLVFAAGISAITILLFAVPAGLRATRVNLLGDLNQGGKASVQVGRFDSVLVTGQIALSLILVITAGLFLSTLRNLLTASTGFATDGVLVVPTDLKRNPHKGADRIALYDQMLDELRAMPGVKSASAEAIPLLSGWVSSTAYASLLPDGSLKSDDQLSYNRIGTDYFSTVGTRILAGREFQAGEIHGSQDVCILNHSAASYFFPSQNAVGQSLRDVSDKTAASPSTCLVVGVVEDAKYTDVRAAAPRLVYTPYAQKGKTDDLFFVIRTDQPSVAAGAAQSVLKKLAPESPLLTPITIREQLKQSIGSERAVAMLAIFFGAIALLLSGIGIFGLLSYRVTQRTREIGIRMALGADRSRVLVGLLKQIAMLVGFGVALGLGASFAITKYVQGMLFGVQSHDLRTLASSIFVLSLVSLLAAFLPAQRATKIDPVIALRYE